MQKTQYERLVCLLVYNLRLYCVDPVEIAQNVADTGGATVASVSATQSVKVAQIQTNATQEISVNVTTTLVNITTESCVEVGLQLRLTVCCF